MHFSSRLYVLTLLLLAGGDATARGYRYPTPNYPRTSTCVAVQDGTTTLLKPEAHDEPIMTVQGDGNELRLLLPEPRADLPSCICYVQFENGVKCGQRSKWRFMTVVAVDKEGNSYYGSAYTMFIFSNNYLYLASGHQTRLTRDGQDRLFRRTKLIDLFRGRGMQLRIGEDISRK